MMLKAIYKVLPAHTASTEGRHLQFSPHVSEGHLSTCSAAWQGSSGC